MNTEDSSDIDSSSNEDDHDLAMLPPFEKANAETDMDSDASDGMNEGFVHHLLMRKEQKYISRDTIKLSSDWQRTDYRR